MIKNNHWEVAPGVTVIELTQCRLSLVDTVDLRKIDGYRWYARRRHNVFYAYSATVRNGHRTTIPMHSLLIDVPIGFEVDHVDGNGLNNSSIFGHKNIIAVTHGENMRNMHRLKTSKYPGVCWESSTGKWKAEYSRNWKRKNLGRFNNEDDAYLAYRQACEHTENSI